MSPECGERVETARWLTSDQGRDVRPGEMGTVVGHRGTEVIVALDSPGLLGSALDTVTGPNGAFRQPARVRA